MNQRTTTAQELTVDPSTEQPTPTRFDPQQGGINPDTGWGDTAADPFTNPLAGVPPADRVMPASAAPSRPSRRTKRHRLAAARIALRAAQDRHDLTHAQAEQRSIDAAGGAKGLGANAEDRSRALTLALADDTAYAEALTHLRQAQAEVDRLQADVDDAIDERRRLDRVSRDRASAAIEQLALLSSERVPVALAPELTHAA